MRTALALLLLCACSAWADFIPERLLFFSGETNLWQAPARISLTAGGNLPNVVITPESTNWTTWNGHGDFSVKCFDKDGTVWVAKWKRQKENAASPPPLPGGHSHWIVTSNYFTTNPAPSKFFALRRSSVEPPMPPLPPSVMSVEERVSTPPGYFTNQLYFTPTDPVAAGVSALGEQPQKPRPHPNIPDHAEHHSKEKERARIAAMLSEKLKAVQSGILYPYEVKELNNFFDTPDDWTGWLIQRRGPQDDHWSECGKSEVEATRTSTVAGTAGYQYRLVRTAP